MATWEDGPECAPLEPPERFTVPDVPPLDPAPPPAPLPSAPAERPGFGDPEQPVAPLATLVPAEGEEKRDPRTPFDVANDALTQGNLGGAWGAAHWRPPGQDPFGGVASPATAWGPPVGAPVLAADPVTIRSAAARPTGGLPAPGTPAWFGPGPAAPARNQPPPSLWKATPPGAIIALAVSVLVWLAPFAFIAGLLLSARARYARRMILTAFGVVGGVVLVIPTIGAVLNFGDLTSWYDSVRSWAVFGSLLMIVLILLMVNSDLKNGPRRPGGHQGGPGGPGPYRDPYWNGPSADPYGRGPAGPPPPYLGPGQPPPQQPPRHSQ